MNITIEKTEGQVELLKLEINEADYKDNVQKSLKRLQKSVDMPGFRKGNVPFGLVEKMYGKAVRSEEVDKLISQKVGDFFSENEENALGSPIPNDEKNKDIDWENQTEYTVYFDFAKAPEFDLDLSKMKATYYNIKADEKLISDSIQNIANQYGQIEPMDAVTESSMVYGKFQELDEKGNLKEGGVEVSTSFLVKMLHTKEIKDLFVGKKKEESIEFEFRKGFDNAAEISSMLKIPRGVAETFNAPTRFTVNFCYDIKPHELNEELFEKVFPEEGVKTEEVFREKIKENLERAYAKETEKVFLSLMQKDLIENTQMELPKEFLVKWFARRSEKKETEEQIESQWDIYERSVKWQLIEKKIAKTENINISKEELAVYIRTNIPPYFLTMKPDETPEEQEKRIDDLVQSVIADEKNVMKFYESLFDQKMADVFKTKMKISEKDISFDEFTKVIDTLNTLKSK